MGGRRGSEAAFLGTLEQHRGSSGKILEDFCRIQVGPRSCLLLPRDFVIVYSNVRKLGFLLVHVGSVVYWIFGFAGIEPA